MNVFDRYSAYYDLFYQDKDYAAETEYVVGLIQQYAPGAGNILEMGAGTGRHAVLLAERGYQVLGVEREPGMLRRAQQRALSGEGASFEQGDVRYVELGRRFDVCLALFHVLSYQTSDRDLRETFANVADHLQPGGLFLFDFWYGPAVLALGPEPRTKRIEYKDRTVTREALPNLDPEKPVVTVRYHFRVTRGREWVDTFEESHRMRYLFLPELQALAQAAGMKVLREEAWLGGPLDESRWSGCMLLQKT